MVLNRLRSTETIRLFRETEKAVWELGQREIIYLSLHCHHQSESRIKMGSSSCFNVSLIVRDKVTRQCPQTATFEVRGELKQNLTFHSTRQHTHTRLSSLGPSQSGTTFLKE